MTERLDVIMARELESEAVLAKIVSSPPDDTTLERLDQLVISAKKADEEVWMVLEQSMVTAAKKNGWLAVRRHFAHSEVHYLLKDRIAARIAAGICEDAARVSPVVRGVVATANFDNPAMRTATEIRLERIYTQTRQIGDILTQGIATPGLEEKMRSVVQSMVYRDCDADKLLSKIADPDVLIALRATVARLAEMPEEEMVQELRNKELLDANAEARLSELESYFKENRADEQATDTTLLNRLVQHGLDVVTASRMQHIEDLIASEYAPGCEAKARSVVKEMFIEAGDNVEVLLEDLCNKGKLHGMRMDVKTRVHQMVRYEENMETERAAQAKLKQQTEAFKAAEAKARRMADDLVRQETEAKLAAELRAAERAKRAERAERERTEREMRQAAERQAQQAAKDRAARERKAAELAERNALKAARLEAQRQEAEDRAARQAIALVQARVEANARRAAKKAEKREKKVCALHLHQLTCYMLTVFLGGQHLRNLLRALRRQAQARHVHQVRRLAARVRHVSPVPARHGRRRPLPLRPRRGRPQEVAAKVATCEDRHKHHTWSTPTNTYMRYSEPIFIACAMPRVTARSTLAAPMARTKHTKSF